LRKALLRSDWAESKRTKRLVVKDMIKRNCGEVSLEKCWKRTRPGVVFSRGLYAQVVESLGKRAKWSLGVHAICVGKKTQVQRWGKKEGGLGPKNQRKSVKGDQGSASGKRVSAAKEL